MARCFLKHKLNLNLSNISKSFCYCLLSSLKSASRIKNLGAHFLRASNDMFAYTIVHLTFCAPSIVAHACMYTNVYFTLHLLQRQIEIF